MQIQTTQATRENSLQKLGGFLNFLMLFPMGHDAIKKNVIKNCFGKNVIKQHVGCLNCLLRKTMALKYHLENTKRHRAFYAW